MLRPLHLLLSLAAGAVGSLLAPVPASAQLLLYNFNDCGRGASAQTTSTGSSGLTEINRLPDGNPFSSKCWSADGVGVTGKPGDYALDLSAATGMGKAGKGGVAIVRDAGEALSGLRSFTLCGWFKAVEPADGGARLFDMMDQDGNGLLLGINGKLIGLQVNKRGWTCKELEFGETGAWVFFAVSYTSSQSSDNLVFYKGIPGKPLQSHRLDAAEAAALPDLKGVAMTMGNNSGFERPFKGLLDNLAVYGSTTDDTGALNEAAIKKIFGSVVPSPGGKFSR